MSDNNENQEHSYDGIIEQNNALPSWWTWIFALSILFAVGYLYYYHVQEGHPSQVALFEKEEAEYFKALEPGPAGPANAQSALAAKEGFNQKLLAASSVSATRELGRAIFETRCTPCHAKGGAGTIGPNLTDDYWIHGGRLEQIAKTITEGVPDKGMISWRGILSEDEIIQVAVYVKSLRGTHPENPKAPQGKKEADEPGL